MDDEIVVMRLDNGSFFSLAGTAAAIWRLIDGSRDRAALLSALAAQYEEDPRRLADDVDALLTQLQDARLLERD
ncbi:MAG: PqqD family protein [Sphingomicrobium sp.]